MNLSDFAVNLFSAVCMVGPVLVIPIIVGPMILRSFPEDPLGKLAGVFTLKPIVASAVLAVLLLNPWNKADPGDVAHWSVLPGAGLTVLIVWKFRHLYVPATPLAYLFLAADFVRFGNTYVWLRALGAEATDVALYSLVAASLLPSAYAILAVVILTIRRNRREMAVKQLSAGS